MKEYSVIIEVEKKDELKIINDYLFNHYDIKLDFFKFNDDRGFRATFECDYPGIPIIEELGHIFPKYDLYEELGIGKFDIKIYIKVVKLPYVPDDWGRVHNSEPIEHHGFFVKKRRPKKPENKT